MTPEKLDEYRGLVKFGSHLGVGGQALQLLLDHIDTLNEVSQAQGRTGIALIAERDALAAELASEKQQLDNALSFYPARIRDLEARIDHLRTVANTSGVRSEDMASAIYRVLSSSPMETEGK